jgi:hypothetical protein
LVAKEKNAKGNVIFDSFYAAAENSITFGG